jgi:NAD(P)-dependent dehydrogenase (short-subunit alcohol dehydrogenase family)
VVTGCGQGIGRAILDRAIADGFIGVGVEIDGDLAEDARRQLGSPHEMLVGDVADQSVLQAAREAAARIGTLHGWVNNAGITRPTTLHDVDWPLAERVLGVNLHGCYFGCAAAVQQFIDQRSGGVIVNVSSVHARAAYCGHSAYDVSKAGIEALTRYVAVEYGRLGIRANAISPGGVRAPGAVAGKSDEELASIAEAHPIGRIAEPEEIAGVASFLLSDDSSFMTGHTLVVDGGLTARCWSFGLDPRLAERYGLEPSAVHA